MSQKKVSKKSMIEKKIKQLEKIVQEFEKGNISIEQGLDKYKDAATLIKSIKKELSQLELKIEEIRNSY